MSNDFSIDPHGESRQKPRVQSNRKLLMFRHLLAATCAILFALAAGSASAQTISQPVGNAVLTGQGTGQNFTATLTGYVTQIQVRARTDGVRTIYFFNGTGSGASGNYASAVRSQSVTLVDQADNNSGFQTIVLTNPLPVIAGDRYAFAFDGATTALTVQAWPQAYAGGTTIQQYNQPFTDADLAFTVTEVVSLPLPPTPVPTMTEWAMILFGLVLAGGAAMMIQRRRMAV